MSTLSDTSFLLGWSEVDISPKEPVFLAGQFYARVSEGIKTPVVATVLALQSVSEAGQSVSSAILISCDLVSIPESLIDRVKEALGKSLADFDSQGLIINATHTHAAPYAHDKAKFDKDGEVAVFPYTFDLPAMKPRHYLDFIVPLIVQAAEQAWHGRQRSAVSHALGYAVLGHNRIVS